MRTIRMLCQAVFAAAATTAVAANAATVVIESWRVDDKATWEKVIIPAFKKSHPGIDVQFNPTTPTEYDSSLTARLAGGTAGDLIACRPFDVSLALYKANRLEKLDGAAGMANFPASAKVAWQTDDGKDTYCMPMASVIHGYLYNKKIFRQLNLQPPTTEAELFAVLDAVQKNGSYKPLALGTADQWESNQTVFTNIGPNYWQGETGRKALIAGKAKFTDPQFVSVWNLEARLGPYMGKGASAQTYADSQNLFGLGKAAIYPAGSWDIAYFNQAPGLEFGAFAPPVAKAGDHCFISDHMDIGMGINKTSTHKAEAQQFLTWLASPEFAELYTNNVTGFFTLSNNKVVVKDPVAQQMIGWRATCSSTIRLNAQILNRGTPSMENELWNVNAQVLNGKLAPAAAAAKMQSGLSKWYKPAP